MVLVVCGWEATVPPPMLATKAGLGGLGGRGITPLFVSSDGYRGRWILWYCHYWIRIDSGGDEGARVGVTILIRGGGGHEVVDPMAVALLDQVLQPEEHRSRRRRGKGGR